MLFPPFEDYLRHIQFAKRYSQNTVDAYTRDIKSFIGWLAAHAPAESWNAITHFQVRGWLSGLRESEGMEARSINRKRAALSSLFQYLLKEGTVQGNPVRRGQPMKIPERLPMFLKESESERLLDDIVFEDDFEGQTAQLILELLYGCGLRREELLKVREADATSDRLHVTGKGGKDRLIPLSDALRDLMQAYIRAKESLPAETINRDVLLVTPRGEPLYPVWVYRAVKKYLSLVCSLKKRSPHILRHTFATQLLSRGANIQAIRDLLGHSTLASTQIYTHTDIEALKEMHRKLHPRG